MPTTFDQQRQRRLRPLADNHGYRLQRLRDDNGYWLLDVSTGGLVIGEQVTRGVNIGYDLDANGDWLTND